MEDLEELKRQLEKANKALSWFNDFADYVENIDRKMYNQACEHADRHEDELD